MSELMAGIGHGDRIGAGGDADTGEDLHAFGAVEPDRVETEMHRQRPVQLDQPWPGHRRRGHPREETRRQRRIGVLEGKMDRHGLNIGMPGI